MNLTSMDRRREQLAAETTEPTPSAAASRTSSSAGARQATPSDATLHAALQRVPVAADQNAFFAQLHAGQTAGTTSTAGATSRPAAQVASSLTALSSPPLRNAREAAIQQRLDAFRDRFSGPYKVEGRSVTAPPMFRMNSPMASNRKSVVETLPMLNAACTKAGIAPFAARCLSGRCTPEELVKVTQALLDAKHLPPADTEHPTLESRVRAMQWKFGVGVDCAGYTQLAAASAHGAAGRVFTTNQMGDLFSGMHRDPRFTEILDPASIHVGDVIHLKNKQAGEVGHNVVVHGHTTLSDQKRSELFATQPLARDFLSGLGPFHVLEVDSSWGAGDGKDFGGFRRDTWLYSESSGTWATYLPLTPKARTSEAPVLYCVPETGPQDELFVGAYRPKEVP